MRRGAPWLLALALAAPGAAAAEPFPVFDGFALESRDATVRDRESGAEIGREAVRVWREPGEGLWRLAVLRDFPGRFTSVEEHRVRLEGAILPVSFRFELKEARGALLRAAAVDYPEGREAIRVRDAEGGDVTERELETEGEPPYVSFLIGLGVRAAVSRGRTEIEYTTVAFSPRLFIVSMRAVPEGVETLGPEGARRRCRKMDLRPELGLLVDWIAGLVAPKTHLWFAEAPPHAFCAFEGLPLPWPAPFEVRVEPGRDLGAIEAPEADFPLLGSERWARWGRR